MWQQSLALHVMFQSVLQQQLLLKGIFMLCLWTATLLRCIQLVYQLQYLSVGEIHYIVVVGRYMASRQAGKTGCPIHSLPGTFCVCQNSPMRLKLQMNSQQRILCTFSRVVLTVLGLSRWAQQCTDTECLGAQLANNQASTTQMWQLFHNAASYSRVQSFF